MSFSVWDKYIFLKNVYPDKTVPFKEFLVLIGKLLNIIIVFV